MTASTGFMIFAILMAIAIVPVIQAQLNVPNGYSLIRNKYAYLADSGEISKYVEDCIKPVSRRPMPFAQSMETLIDYIERLEEVLANTTDSVLSKIKSPQDVARLILHRFHTDGVDFQEMVTPYPIKMRAEIDTQIIGRSPLFPPPNVDYYFPDSIYNEDELCSMFFMFSQVFLNTSSMERYLYKRATYDFSNTNTLVTDNNPSQAKPLQEKGVVSLRQNPNEAIAPARVLIGILAGLTKSAKLNGAEISNLMNKPGLNQPSNLKDHVLAVTLASLGGTAVFFDSGKGNKYEEAMIFGATGKWMDDTCCTYYGITSQVSLETLSFSNRGSMAQLRGSIDGYIIGKMLQKISAPQDLRLSSILRSYYSVPHASSGGEGKFTISYCDRQNLRPNQNDLSIEATAYSEIFKYITDSESGNTKINKFTAAVDQASTHVNDMCSEKPQGNLDKNSPCETPSDLLFIVDPKREKVNRTASVITDIITKINRFGKYAGTVSVFLNSNSKPNTVTNLPGSPWPLGPLVFNSTNIGMVSCPFKQDSFNYGALTSIGQFFHQVNQTITNYKWWTPRRFMAGTPSTSVIIIDYDTLKPPNNDKDRWEYDTYKDQLRWDNPDVRYLVMSNNQKDFDDILMEKSTDLISANQGLPGKNWAKRICENPAKLIYNDCAMKPSENIAHSGFVSVGYKQNWAMYPEYFHRSFDMEFEVKADEGAIKFCWDRKFPPEDPTMCKDLTMGSKETFYISNPCHHQSVHSCLPIYITVWGKERTTPCTDVACQNLAQAKFTITHKGVSCNSSLKLGSAAILQIICLLIAFLNYRNFF